MCLVKNVGVDGNLFGGEMMSWMDEISAIFAYETLTEEIINKYNSIYLPKIHLVTLRFGEIIFKKPVKVGNIVNFYGFNVKYGKTSITFNIKAEVNGEVVFMTDCTFVRVDDDGNKLDIFKL